MSHIDDVQLRTALRHHTNELDGLAEQLITDDRGTVIMLGHLLQGLVRSIRQVTEFFRQETR